MHMGVCVCVNNGNFSTATVNIVQRLTSGTLLFSRGTLRSERCCFLGCSAPLLTWQGQKEREKHRCKRRGVRPRRARRARGRVSKHQHRPPLCWIRRFRVGGDITGPHTWEVWSVRSQHRDTKSQ